jgi:hypothetical protein
MTNDHWTQRTDIFLMPAGATTLDRFIHTNSFQSSSTVLYSSLTKLRILCNASLAMTVINPHLRISSHLLRNQNDLFF